MRTRLTVVALLAAAATTLRAQAPRPFRDGEVVLLRAPIAAAVAEEQRSFWFSGKRLVMDAAPDSAGGVTVNRSGDWLASGFSPWRGTFRITSIKRDKKLDRWRVYLSSPTTAQDVEVRLPSTDSVATRVFRALTAGENERASVRAASYARLAATGFEGPLAAVRPENRLKVLAVMDSASALSFTTQEFRGKPHMVLNLGVDSVVYNDARLSQTQRVAQVINERMLGVLKVLGAAAKDEPSIQGVGLRLVTSHRNFVTAAEAAKFEQWTLYVPVGEIARFANADITSQDLMDASALLIDGNRVKIVLSQ